MSFFCLQFISAFDKENSYDLGPPIQTQNRTRKGFLSHKAQQSQQKGSESASLILQSASSSKSV